MVAPSGSNPQNPIEQASAFASQLQGLVYGLGTQIEEIAAILPTDTPQLVATHLEVLSRDIRLLGDDVALHSASLVNWANIIQDTNKGWINPATILSGDEEHNVCAVILSETKVALEHFFNDRVAVPILDYVAGLTDNHHLVASPDKAQTAATSKRIFPTLSYLADSVAISASILDRNLSAFDISIPSGQNARHTLAGFVDKFSPRLTQILTLARDGVSIREQLKALSGSESAEVVLGRAHGLESPTTSKAHAKLAWSDGHLMLSDSGSTNGTALITQNGIRRVSNGSVPLRAGNYFSLICPEGETPEAFLGALAKVPSGRLLPTKIDRTLSSAQRIEVALEGLEPGQSVSIGTSDPKADGKIQLSGPSAAALDPVHLTIERIGDDARSNLRRYRLIDSNGRAPSVNGIVLGLSQHINFGALQAAAGDIIELPTLGDAQPVRIKLP
ncbi:MAG: FHA domain-containing protein [Oligoflexia bacterium]|nr:FHA domain-containing protein [Oligoflexia bacterium]